MKKLVSLLALCAMLTAIFAGCGAKQESAQSVTESAIKSVKNMDTDAIEHYWGSDAFDLSSDSEDEKESKEMVKLIVSSLSYKILSSDEDKDAGTATVSVEFTNVDMSEVMTTLLTELISEVAGSALSSDGQQPTDEEMAQKAMDKLKELLAKKDNKTVTNKVNISLSLDDGEWKIEPNEEVVDAMFGGMLSYVGSMGSMF